MPTIQDVRQRFPQYDDLSDEQLLTGVHRKFYSDMPFGQFMSNFTTTAPTEGPSSEPTAESVGRTALQRNVLDPVERGYQNLMLGVGAIRAQSPESFYGLSPEEASAAMVYRQRRLREIPQTEASQRAFREAGETGSVPGAVSRLAQSSSALGDIGLESFGSNPLAAPVGVLQNVTPVPALRQIIGAVGAALGFPTEFATSMGESLLKTARDRGIDPTNPDQLASLIKAVNENPELKAQMRDDALTRASIISAVDVAAGAGSGRLVTRGFAGRVGGGAAVEGLGGGVGEAAAQLATEGKIDPTEVAAEILGGGGMGAAGNLRRSPTPRRAGEAEDEELRGAIADIVAAREPEAQAPLALPRERPSVDFPGGMLTRTQSENYLNQLQQIRYPEIQFMPFEDKVRYVRDKLEQEQAAIVAQRQAYEEAIMRREIAFSPETQEAFNRAELQRQNNLRISDVVDRIPLERNLPYAGAREAEATEAFRQAELQREQDRRAEDVIGRVPLERELPYAGAREGEATEAFRQAELQRRTGVRPDIEAVGPVQELSSAQNRLQSFMASSRDVRSRLEKAEKKSPRNAVELEALRAEAADLVQKIKDERANIVRLRNEIPQSEREATRRGTMQGQAGSAFEIAQARRERAGPTVTDLRVGAAAPDGNRLVLEPQFDARGRLVGGESIKRLSEPSPDGKIIAYVDREVDGELQEVAVKTDVDKIYQFPMLETPRITQETIAARVGPEQVSGAGRGSAIDPNKIDLQPRRVTDRVTTEGEAQAPRVAAPTVAPTTTAIEPETKPDWRLGEVVESAPEQPVVLPAGLKELLAFMRKGRAAPKGQVSLVQAIINAGGLKDTGGEIKQFLGGDVRKRPALIHRADRKVEAKGNKAGWKGGFQIDQAAEWLAGQGYFIDIPSDNELLNAISDELSHGIVNYGPTEDVKGQELAAAARELEREMDAVGVTMRDSDGDIARALNIEPESRPRTLEDIEREDEARRYSARRTEPEAQTETTTTTETEEAPPNVDKARAIVKKYLDNLRAKGKQGRLLANALEDALKNKKLNANQIYEAFKIDEAILRSMPAGANYRLRFVEDIIIDNSEAAKASGSEVGKRAQGKIIRPTESLPGFIYISLAEDMLPILRETASHEAFHILQDYFGAYDKGFAALINKHFKKDMTISQLEPSIKRRLQSMKAPGSNVSYWESLKSGLGDTKLEADEAQAYAFGALVDAAMRGQKVTGLTAPFQRFFNFIKNTFSALRSGLRGDGFQTPASLLAGASDRAASLTQAAPTTGTTSYSARGLPKEIRDTYESFADELAAPILYADKNVALLEGISRTGKPVYIGARSDGYRTTVDIENYTGKLFTKEQSDILKNQKKNRIKLDAELFNKNPNGPFSGSSKFAATDNIPENLKGFGEGLVRLLGMNDIKVFFVSDKDADVNSNFTDKYKLHGTYARARESMIKDDSYGVMYPEAKNKFYTVKIKSGLRPSMQVETMAHEIGHIFQKVALNEAPEKTVNEILDAHARWYEKNKGGSVRQYISAMRPAIMGRTTIGAASASLRDQKVANLDNFYGYWSSFDEWFADQVARWASTDARPSSLVDKFFARIADAYRKIVNALAGIGLPDQTVANFINSYVDGKLTEKAPSTKMKPGEQLSLFAAKPEERLSARAAPTQYAARSQPNANAAARSFFQIVKGDMNKPGVFEAALAKFIDKRPGESIGSAIVRTGINRAGAMHNLDTMVKGQGYTGKSAGMAMEMALMNSGRIEQMLSSGVGKIDPNTMRITRRADIKPLLKIMKDNGIDGKNKDAFQVYGAALRERDLRKSGKKGLLDATNAQIDQAIKDSEAQNPKWKTAASELQKFNSGLIDWALDTGLINKTQARGLSESFYMPFYRLLDEDSKSDPSRSVSPKIGDSFQNVASALNKKLKGGEDPLGDFFENIIRNADSIMKAGLKNLAMKTAAETMEFAKAGRKNTTGIKGKNTITYKVDGKDVNFDVDDPVLFSALAGMSREMQHGIYQTMAKMASIFRDFVTVAPSFIFTNLYKGKISAFVQEGQPFFTNTFAGMRDALNASTSLQNFQLQTGFGGYTYGMGERNIAKAFERKLSDEGVMKALGGLKVFSAMRQGFEKLQAVSEASEMAERIKLAERLIKQGVPEQEAYFQAYLLAPYSRRGTGEGWLGATLQFLMPLVPFLNAKVQTTYRLIENEKGDKRHLWTLGLPQQLFLRGLVVTAFSLAAYGASLGEDEEKWDKIPNYLKLNYDFIPVPGGSITLPRAFEIGAVFGALPVFILDAIRRGESKDLAEALLTVGQNTFWMNPIPKAVDPLLSVLFNYDTFRGRPLETKGEQALPVGERINRSTTKTGEALSATVNSIFRNVLSPIKAQALLDGYTGTLGVSLMTGFDGLLAASGAIPGKPSGAFGDPSSMPGILANFAGMNRFYRDDAQMVSRFVGDFYKIKEMTDQLIRSQNLAKQAGDYERLSELAGEAGLPLRMKDVVNRASTQVSDLNKRISMLERGRGDAADRAAAIEPLIRRRDQITKRVVDQARDLGVF
jgi:hypothetical protein